MINAISSNYNSRPLAINQSQNFGQNSFAKKIKMGTFIASMAALSIMNTGCGSKVYENEKKLSQNVEWNQNVRVVASQGQNLKGESTAPIWGGGESFTKALTDKAQQKNIQSIEESVDSLMQSGYSIGSHKFTPIKTPGKELGIFNKNEKNKDRYVLVLAQEDGIKYEFIADDFIKDMQKTYNVPEKNIIKVVSNYKDDLLGGIDAVSKKIDELKNKKNAELVIYYTGHGGAVSTGTGSSKLEGAMEGHIIPKYDQNTGDLVHFLRETDVKNALDNKIRKVKTLFIMDTCHSGAWIAKNSEKAGKEALKTLSYLA